MPDVDWYIMQQLLPPITRLIEHIEGIEVDFVAQCLGVDPKKYKYHTQANRDENGENENAALPSAILKTETQTSLKDRSIAKLTVKCPNCEESNEIAGIFRHDKKGCSGLICKNEECNQLLPEKFLKNRLTLFLRQLLDLYYDGKHFIALTYIYFFFRHVCLPRARLQAENPPAISQFEVRQRCVQRKAERRSHRKASKRHDQVPVRTLRRREV